MLKRALLITSLAVLSACQSPFPKPPQHVQYGVHADIDPPGFYGVDSKTKQRFYKPFADGDMKGAQCLSAPDFERGQQHIKDVNDIIKNRCTCK